MTFDSITIRSDPQTETLIGLRAPSRALLLDWLQGYPRDPAKPLLTITLDACQSSVSYQEAAEIPDHDVPCACGNSRHWFLRYDEVKQG